MPGHASSSRLVDAESRFPDAASHTAGLEVLAQSIARSCPAWLRSEQADLFQNAVRRLLEVEAQADRTRDLCRSYLYRIARSVVIDEIRKRRTLQYSDDEDVETQRSPISTPEETAHGNEIRSAVRQSMVELSESRRVAVSHFLQGYTIKECAEAMGWTEKRAENLVYRGIAELRRLLVERGLHPGSRRDLLCRKRWR
jgi:RNA polymerase sigma-70 factor (ECF subfamily)